MTKTELLNKCARDADERITLARVLDRLKRAESRSAPEYTPFLSPAERAAVDEMLRLNDGGAHHVFFGGYDGAERCICAFLPDWMVEDDFFNNNQSPIAAVETELNRGINLSHRDILGSLMGLGLTREKTGDILMPEGKCQVIVLREALHIILSQWEFAGRLKVVPREIPLSELAIKPSEMREVRDTVASLRLDSVLASGFSLSRTRAAELILAGKVSINYREVIKPDRAAVPGDVISCRGLGKCILREVSGKSRKDRLIIKIDRYI